MNATHASLLERLRREADPASPDWQRLHDLYVPLVRAWASRNADIAPDADDISQEVFLVLVRELPNFHRRRDGSFRVWLRKVVANRIRSHRRATARAGLPPAEEFLSHLEDPASDLAQQWDRDHDKYLCDRLLAAVQADVAPATFRAFRLFVLEGRSAAQAAAETGLTENAVLVAKSRILKRLREEAADLLS